MLATKLGNVNYLYGPPENCATPAPSKGTVATQKTFALEWCGRKITQGLSKRSATWGNNSSAKSVPSPKATRSVSGLPVTSPVAQGRRHQQGHRAGQRSAWQESLGIHAPSPPGRTSGWLGRTDPPLPRTLVHDQHLVRTTRTRRRIHVPGPALRDRCSVVDDPRKQWRTAGGHEFGSARTRSTRKFSAIDACSATSAQLTWPSPSSRTEPRKKTSMLPWLRRHHPYLPLPFARHGTHNTTP